MTSPDRQLLSCSTWNLPGRPYDLIVVGAGHAGIEAAWAAARLGLRTLLVTQSLQTIGQMSCNPAIGGVGKGQLVREIDAMGGAMGYLADRTRLQYRMLNRSKGPAVWSPRVQSDKGAYAAEAFRLLDAQPGLDMRQGSVVGLSGSSPTAVDGVEMDNGTVIRCGAVILCAGTFLNGLIHVGASRTASGRAGEPPALGLTQSLLARGVKTIRFKTGTPPRVDRDSIRFASLDVQQGDPVPGVFRYYDPGPDRPQLPCYLTWTSERTHALLRDNLAHSPLFSGQIAGTGPRYCPSVEDKVVRFADKDRHQIFLEPETACGREMYVNGFSTSMPEAVQLAALRTVPGFEEVRFIRPGYAIEYDCFPSWQLDVSLRLRHFTNLFLAGQINGSSGYEEAAAQGLLAGINAFRALSGLPPFILGRNEAYMGVLVDDLVNKPHPEPYRMFTSRAEFRLLLRQDNADERLMPISHALGLLEEWRWQHFLQRGELRDRLVSWLRSTSISPGVVRDVLRPPESRDAADFADHAPSSPGLGTAQRAVDWVRRPDVALSALVRAAGPPWAVAADAELLAGIELNIKYEGYIGRQQRAVERFRQNEGVVLPEDLDYHELPGLSREARERMASVRPRSLGQAARIGGVNPTDVQALWIHLQRRRLSRREGPASGPIPVN